MTPVPASRMEFRFRAKSGNKTFDEPSFVSWSGPIKHIKGHRSRVTGLPEASTEKMSQGVSKEFHRSTRATTATRDTSVSQIINAFDFGAPHANVVSQKQGAH